MAHEIVNNMISYKGVTPWHGLGVKVDDSMDGAAMLAAAKMDWRVQRRALAMRGLDGQGLMTGPLKGYRAIVREDTDEVFQVATDRYHPVQNAQIVDFFRAFCEAGHATMDVVGGLKNGAIPWALAKLNDNGASDASIGGVDEMKGYIMLATSHDGSIRTIAKATNTRVVCWNTMSAAMGGNGAMWTLKHSAKWTADRAQEAQQVMGMAISQIATQNELIEKLSRVRIDDKGREEYVIRLLGNEGLLEQVTNNTTQDHQAIGIGLLESIASDYDEKSAGKTVDPLGRIGKAILEAIVNSPGSDLITAKNTMWGAYNGVSYYVDHLQGRTQDTRLNSAWFGNGNKLKVNAFEVACGIAGINTPQPRGVYA